jgi:hypothetical protein
MLNVDNILKLHHPKLPHQPAAEVVCPPRARTPRRHVRISGQSLAKGNREPCELAHLAANWVLGSLTIDPPTTALAVQVFGVSATLIRKAADDIRSTTVAQPAINSVWTEMEYEDRLEFVRTNLAELWTLIERVTA